MSAGNGRGLDVRNFGTYLIYDIGNYLIEEFDMSRLEYLTEIRLRLAEDKLFDLVITGNDAIEAW